MSDFLSFIADQASKSDLADWADRKYGIDSERAALAHADPGLFREVLLREYDPKAQQAKTQMSALAQLAQGGSDQTLSSAGGQTNLPQGIPLDADTALSMMGQNQQQPSALGAMDGQNKPGLSQRQLQLMAIADPSKFIDYLVNQNDPEKVAKTQQEIQKANAPIKAKSDVTRMLDEMSSLTTDLDKEGGIVNTDKYAITNIGRYFANTEGAMVGDTQVAPGGQNIGRMFGTKEQEIRDKIASKIPLVTQAIKSATGMSAQQMNSNFELSNFLKIYGSPTSSFQTRQDALSNLKKSFGNESVQQPPNALQQGVNSSITPEMARAELARRRGAR